MTSRIEPQESKTSQVVSNTIDEAALNKWLQFTDGYYHYKSLTGYEKLDVFIAVVYLDETHTAGRLIKAKEPILAYKIADELHCNPGKITEEDYKKILERCQKRIKGTSDVSHQVYYHYLILLAHLKTGRLTDALTAFSDLKTSFAKGSTPHSKDQLEVLNLARFRAATIYAIQGETAQAEKLLLDCLKPQTELSGTIDNFNTANVRAALISLGSKNVPDYGDTFSAFLLSQLQICQDAPPPMLKQLNTNIILELMNVSAASDKLNWKMLKPYAKQIYEMLDNIDPVLAQKARWKILATGTFFSSIFQSVKLSSSMFSDDIPETALKSLEITFSTDLSSPSIHMDDATIRVFRSNTEHLSEKLKPVFAKYISALDEAHPQQAVTAKK